ncbi:hypothetical protein ACFFQW_11325 [Umezawaea endophytica]|uniref:Uncharacterized protein n=1 Tax=Umezawaea endophytica TaxID=1654476 RepID=A0A9X2VL16_9PSEU|nr:hypothetical protein [Umezawaea endophytica]MCS7478012.1 hypothetical protein [Umezawaea endophytica]
MSRGSNATTTSARSPGDSCRRLVPHAEAMSPPSVPMSWNCRSSENPKLYSRAFDALSRRRRTRREVTST